jgi:hypothetical protein
MLVILFQIQMVYLFNHNSYNLFENEVKIHCLLLRIGKSFMYILHYHLLLIYLFISEYELKSTQ